MSDLSSLFPNLASALDDWDGRKTASDGHDDPAHAGVTDDDIEQYLTQMGSLRAPLNPVVSGQTPPPTPEFAHNGRAVPPSKSYMEPPDPAAVQQGDGYAADEGEGEDEGSSGAPPLPPPLPPAATTPDFVEIGGRKYDRRQAQAWADFDQLLQTDPQLQAIIQSHLQTKSTGQAVPRPDSSDRSSATGPVSPWKALPDLPPLPDGWEDDESLQGLYKAVQAQREAIDRVSAQAAQAEQLAASNAQRTYTDIAKGAMSEFQRQHALDDEIMQAVSRAAAATGFAEKYMAGIDPLTGTPVAPDPYKAVISALNAGYMMAPETREIEITRLAASRIARRAEDDARKQKLAGVSGASGSVPRTQSVPSNPSDARAALVEEVTQMFNGSWAGDGT